MDFRVISCLEFETYVVCRAIFLAELKNTLNLIFLIICQLIDNMPTYKHKY